MEYSTSAHAKFILTGEHSVLRGGGALVFPLNSKQVKLNYTSTPDLLTVSFSGESEESMSIIFWGLLDSALTLIGRYGEVIKGKIYIENSIPLGMGLGFSAAICVVLTKFFISLGWIEEGNLVAFATKLEDYFHGKSSGIDVLGVTSDECVFFSGGSAKKNLVLPWRPKFYLMYTGHVSVTAKCIKKVQNLALSDQCYATDIDNEMSKSVLLAKEALELGEEGFEQLCASMEAAQLCFEKWGLVPPAVSDKIAFMKQNGAAAVKLTGAGDGGYLLGIWRQSPVGSLKDILLELN
ncbi:MAG: hypothetical protein VX335_02745 [Pseudomonadota bacterium]|nr:hypothetical protein [Pseudomonadota bacterium]